MNDDFDSLFDTQKLDTLSNESLKDRQRVSDGLYRIDHKKAKDPAKGYIAEVRFLPNFTKEGNMGTPMIEKSTHFVNIKTDDANKELTGTFDSPLNFPGEDKRRCKLSNLYYALDKSTNAVLKEKAKLIQFSRKCFAYVLIMKDEQQPEVVGKVMIYQFGKQIKDKIKCEENGDNADSTKCNVFRLDCGKTLKLIVKDSGNNDGFPTYINSIFMSASPISVYNEEKKAFKQVPLDENGNIESKYKVMIKDMLLNREHDLEEFAAKVLTDAQNAKIDEITAYLTGNTAQSSSKPAANDFDFNEPTTAKPATKAPSSTDADDFFDDI